MNIVFQVFLIVGLLLGIVAEAAPGIPRRGGNSGGGGDMRPLLPLTEFTLSEFLKRDVPRFAKWYFNFLHPFSVEVDKVEHEPFQSLSSDNDALAKSTYQKLFLERETIFDRISTAKILPQETPCLDPVTGEFKDASANVDTNTLCFNVVSLVQKVPYYNLRGHVLSLAVHEYSHLVKTDEEEAKLVEDMADAYVATDGALYGRLIAEWDGVEYSTPGELVKLRRIIENFADIPSGVLVFEALTLWGDLREFIERPDQLALMTGLHGWDRVQRMKSAVLQVKLQALMSFACSMPEMVNLKWSDEKDWGCGLNGLGLFGNLTEVPIAKVLEEHLRFIVPVPWVVRNLTKGDRALLLEELKEIDALFRDLYPGKTNPNEN